MWGLQAHGAMLDFHVCTGHFNLGPTVCVANNLNPSKQVPQAIYVLNWPKHAIDMTFRGDYTACRRNYSFHKFLVSDEHFISISFVCYSDVCIVLTSYG